VILRRIIEHTRAQAWTAIFLDFVIVVLGVFIGIQVSNWNEGRRQATQQQVYLERLREDFEGIRARLDEHLQVYADAIDGGDYILSIVRADTNDPAVGAVDETRLERALNALNSGRVPPPAPATYVEMVSEGQLSSIRDTTLRDRLAEYDRLLGVVQEVSRNVLDLRATQTPILMRHFDSRTVIDETALSGVREELLSYDVAGMRGDPDFAIAVRLLQSNALNSQEQRRIQIGLIEEILSLLETEQPQ